MKKIIFPLCFCLYAATSIAQQIPTREIEDSVLGWMKVYNFRGVREPLKVDAKLYTPAQLSIADSFANWMQVSYVPTGGLGDVKISVSEKLGLYNKSDAAMPQSYGAVANTYSQLKYNANGKLVLLTSDAIGWSIMANAPVGIPTDAICTPTQYYFTLPSFKEHGYSDDDSHINSLATHPNTKKYPAYVARNTSGLFEIALLLYPQNAFPYIKITKGEYIEQVAAAIERKYLVDKEEAVTKWFTDATRANARQYADDKYQKRISVLKYNKEKYKNRLDETAEIFTVQPDILLENYPDIFLGNGGGSLKLAVYKIDPVIAERCKKGNPQWVTIFWNGGLNDAVGKNQHESIINNFNFDYLYKFCFDPEKVKGQPYKPLRSPAYKGAVLVNEASEASKKNTTDKNIFFFEDFSTTANGKKPVGWEAKLGGGGTTGVVTQPEGLEGNWVELKGHYIDATMLKNPLPQNFTLTYEMAVPQNFTWGASGLAFQLSKETTPGKAESYLNLRLRPGFDGSDGEARVETKFTSPPGYLNGTKYAVATGFSNNKKYNRIIVTIKKKEELLQIFIDNNKIAEYEKAIPSGLLFNALSFSHGGGDGETAKFYISNIKITKE